MPETSPLQEVLQRVPGLDVAVALDRFDGMEDLLTRLLARFRDDQQGFMARVEALLSRGEVQEALRLVHSLKGVAGNLALTPVYEAAGALEKALRSAPHEAAPLHGPLHVVLEQTLAALHGAPLGQPPPFVVPGAAMPRPQLVSLLEELSGRLARGEPTAAELAVRLEGPLTALGHAETAASLKRATAAYASAQATSLVSGLLAKLGR